MDPVELLDILGNENRRRILQLLSFRPFYFNEMAKRLDVGPKAVIDHLEMLRRAGLIECYQDERRRKYFRIARDMVLEVAVSPHSYSVRTYRSRDAPRVQARQVGQDMRLLQEELESLERRRAELRGLLDEIESRESAIKQTAVDMVRGLAQDQLELEILVALLSGGCGAAGLAERLEVPQIVLEDRLRRLQERGVVSLRGQEWIIGEAATKR